LKFSGVSSTAKVSFTLCHKPSHHITKPVLSPSLAGARL
jgi:hypothetical protein